MSEFTYLYRGRDTTASPEQMQKVVAKWATWFSELASQGHLTSPGNPFELSGKLVKGKEKIVTDGPYAEAKDVVGGYTVIEAQDITEAVELAKGCPILEVGGSVEVRPIQIFRR